MPLELVKVTAHYFEHGTKLADWEREVAQYEDFDNIWVSADSTTADPVHWVEDRELETPYGLTRFAYWRDDVVLLQAEALPASGVNLHEYQGVMGEQFAYQGALGALKDDFPAILEHLNAVNQTRLSRPPGAMVVAYFAYDADYSCIEDEYGWKDCDPEWSYLGVLDFNKLKEMFNAAP